MIGFVESLVGLIHAKLVDAVRVGNLLLLDVVCHHPWLLATQIINFHLSSIDHWSLIKKHTIIDLIFDQVN